MAADEGSDERKRARHILITHAQQAFVRGYSYYGWLEHEDQRLIDAVSQQDLDAIFAMTWTRKKRR